MAASFRPAATVVQPTDPIGASSRTSLQLRPVQNIGKTFGVDTTSARVTCSIHKDMGPNAPNIAGFPLATSASAVSEFVELTFASPSGDEIHMASTSPLAAAQSPPAHPTPRKAHVSKHAQVTLPSRRQCLLLFTATTALTAMEVPARAQDIPLFGLRKGLRKVEEEAELIVKEGLEAAEKEIQVAEKEVELAEKEIEGAVRTSNLAQAGAVAVVELLGVVIASSIVKAILGPEVRKA